MTLFFIQFYFYKFQEALIRVAQYYVIQRLMLQRHIYNKRNIVLNEWPIQSAFKNTVTHHKITKHNT